jgi:hypothetical protein|tara:strand:- start:1320 stop:1505 length:186 start_codon:yes stop_codon:yes gene_type:complete
MSEGATKIFNALVNNDNAAAKEEFSAAIADKVQSTMDVKKVQMTGDIFNNGITKEPEEAES